MLSVKDSRSGTRLSDHRRASVRDKGRFVRNSCSLAVLETEGSAVGEGYREMHPVLRSAVGAIQGSRRGDA